MAHTNGRPIVVGVPRLTAAALAAILLSAPGAISAASSAAGDRSNWLEAPALPAYSVTSAGFTVELWVRVRSLPGFDIPLIICIDQSKGNPGAMYWSLAICNLSACAPGCVWVAFQTGGTSAELSFRTRVDDGRYHHLAVTCDRTTLRLYADGSLDQSKVVGPLAVRITRGRLLAGTAPDHLSAFDGDIDELRIWSVARSAEDIRSTLALPVDPAARSLEGCWPFDGDAGDRSAHRNSLVPHYYVAFPKGRVIRAAEIMNEGLFRG